MEKKISVIIPNFNGRDLLAKNLPAVLKECQDCEIIAVDDASTDDSVTFLKKNFKTVKVLTNEKNRGFASSVNKGVANAKGDYILLLNTDISPRKGFLKSAVPHFVKNKNLFAVGLADYSHEGPKVVIRGRGGAKFSRGFLNHFALNPKADETLWVSGGSSIIDREKFLELGGFSPVFAPFYWEDIDLSYRARKRGYICLFEPNSKVDHFHEEGAIKKNKSQFLIKTVAYKNQFLFVWKNISDYLWILEHLMWLPYHFVRALLTFDLEFFTGFFWALYQIPKLIFVDEPHSLNYKLSDKEVLGGLEKS